MNELPFKSQDDFEFFNGGKSGGNSSAKQNKSKVTYRRSDDRHLFDPVTRSIRIEKTTDDIILEYCQQNSWSLSEAVEKLVLMAHNRNKVS